MGHPVATVIGLGKVGLPIACHLAQVGYEVRGYDTNSDLVGRIRAGENPLPWEEGVDPRLVWATQDLSTALSGSSTVYIIVPTPMEHGALSSKHVVEALEAVRRQRWRGLIIVGSTLDPRDTKRVIEWDGVVYSPPLIRLGHVIHDTKYPALGLVGRNNPMYGEATRKFWGWGAPTKVVEADPVTIAVAKLAINTTLSLRIGWANEVADVAQAYGADAETVLEAMRSDPRIGEGYMRPGWVPSGPCFLPHTAVYTDHGLVPISDIVVGDKVIGCDGKFHKVTDTMSREYSGEVLRIQVTGGAKFTCTPEHPFWVAPRPGAATRFANSHLRPFGAADPAWVEAEDLRVGDFMLRPVRIAQGEVLDQIRLSVWEPRTNCSSGEYIVLTDVLAWFLGVYAAEGHSDSHKLCFTLHRMERGIAEKLVEVGRSCFGCTGKIIERSSNSLRVELYSTAAAKFLTMTIGAGATNKHLPTGFNLWPEILRVSLLAGLFVGDGSWSDGRFTLGTTALGLWEDTQMALMLSGIAFSISKAPPRIGADGVPHRRSYYIRAGHGFGGKEISERIWSHPSGGYGTKNRRIISVGEEYYGFPVRKIDTTRYTGNVYNLEVAECESYMLEGGVVAHNCLPRDLEMWKALTHGDIAEALYRSHEETKTSLVAQVVMMLQELGHDHVAVLGMTYNPNALDITNSQGLAITAGLTRVGSVVKLFDPASSHFPNLLGWPVVGSVEEALEGATAVIVCTPWPEFKALDMGDRFVLSLVNRRRP